MKTPFELKQALQDHLSLYRETLGVIEHEGQEWRRPSGTSSEALLAAKKDLLPRLKRSLDELRVYRASWQKLAASERAQYPEIASLIRQSQDFIMKILLLDRDNEQTLLRRGLLPPRSLPSANCQRPHFVAGLYSRQSTT
jgi:hypothetical protein